MNKFVSFFSQLNVLIIAATITLALVGGGVVYYQHTNSKELSEESTTKSTESDSSYNPITPVKEVQGQNADESTASENTTTTAPQPTYTVPDNSAKCDALVAEAKTKINLLNSQIKEQLAIMQNIINLQKSSLYDDVTGSGTTGMLSRSQDTQQFNAASAKVDELSPQLTSTKSSYVDQLLALNCATQAKTLFYYQAQ